MNDAMNAIGGPASWATPVVFLVGALGIGLLLFVSARVTRRYPRSSLTVRCPTGGERADCTAIYDLATAQWINISSCPRPGFPSCGRECLRR